MKIDLAKIDSQIKKLEDLKRIAADPELMSMLEAAMVNGNGSHPLPGQKPAHRPKDSDWMDGTVVGSIAKAAMMMDRPFSGYELAKKMQDNGFRFNSSKPGVYVADVLRNSLVKKGIVAVARKGYGSDPTLFEIL